MFELGDQRALLLDLGRRGFQRQFGADDRGFCSRQRFAAGLLLAFEQLASLNVFLFPFLQLEFARIELGVLLREVFVLDRDLITDAAGLAPFVIEIVLDALELFGKLRLDVIQASPVGRDELPHPAALLAQALYEIRGGRRRGSGLGRAVVHGFRGVRGSEQLGRIKQRRERDLPSHRELASLPRRWITPKSERVE